MRLPDGTYQLQAISFDELSDLMLLKHYPSIDTAFAKTAMYQLRVSEIMLHGIEFVAAMDLGQDLIIRLWESNAGISVRTSSPVYDQDSLTRYEYLAIYAVMHITAYRVFFQTDARREMMIPYAKPYGLESESDLDLYFDLVYDKGSIAVRPANEAILRADLQEGMADGLPLPATTDREIETTIANQNILVLGLHKFYAQLRFVLVNVGTTQSGKPKAPFQFLDTSSMLWKEQSTSAVKFYAALGTFASAYEEKEEEQDLAALIAIQRNPLSLPVYIHDRGISDNITAKSIRPIAVEILQATMVLRVFKRQPFYELTATLRWHEQELPVKTLPIKHRYFLHRDQVFSLIDNVHMLRLIEYFRKRPEILLIHESKYAAFEKSVLEPLEDAIEIQYATIRPATKEEKQVIRNDTEKIIYLAQRGNYVYLTPVVRYGTVEIPLVTKKQIKGLDANGNAYLVERNEDLESKFKALLSAQHPYFAEQWHERDFFYLHHEAFVANEWFLSVFERLRQEGIRILGAQNLKLDKLNIHTPKIDIKILSGTDWFNAKIAATYGDQQASIKQLYRAIRNKQRYVALDDGTRGILPEEWIAKLSNFFALGAVRGEQIDIPKARFVELQDLNDEVEWSPETKSEVDLFVKRLHHRKEFPTVEVPEALQAKLRRYQIQGLAWLSALDNFNFGGCLADDMGLGKTLQIIALLLAQRNQGDRRTALVVLPTSLLFNWESEIQTYAPSLSIHILYGKGRDLPPAEWSDFDVLITTYGVMVSDISRLKKFSFDTIILDESQAIKNPSSIRYKSALQLKSRNRFVLTGTPIENSTYDLYGQLSFACPGLLGSMTYFRDTYSTPIDRFDDHKRAAELQKYTAPFILRRTKKQVATELPEKTEMIIYCELGEQQRTIYNAYEAELRHYVDQFDEDELEQNSMNVLAGLTRLRQIANAPALLKEGYETTISAKIDAMLEQLDSIIEQHKVIIFSQFVGMLNLIRGRLDDRKLAYSYLTGQTADRANEVEQFQTSDDRRVFLVSLKAGGTGLNLTAADYVFLMDPWWNPAVENQAIDRSYRIGQEKRVTAVRFIAVDTVEQKMMTLQQKKRDLAGSLISPAASKIPRIGKDDLLNLLA
ncbi:DEAD/DEAH box helicase [Sphingobacterium chungjuense]|uniref:DEAD/DEAH box helicase n=1 Tax=Sphingobacterium chungjuense TaxID=2675553 RepID=UPI0014080090|nr:DEAD/DEAH box helicase [Sphingobacterium chungjuense]